MPTPDISSPRPSSNSPSPSDQSFHRQQTLLPFRQCNNAGHCACDSNCMTMRFLAVAERRPGFVRCDRYSAMTTLNGNPPIPWVPIAVFP